VTHYFLDSSAVVKRYVNEAGSLWIRNLFSGSAIHTILIAQITPVEVYSGVIWRVREGTVDPSVVDELRRAFLIQLRPQYNLVSFTQQVIGQAQDLLEKHPLRAYDAVQLASAMTTNTLLVTNDVAPLVFVSADRRLAQAAVAEGLLTEDLGLHN
jgi:predicted nucleic acid-binding protein